MVEDDAAHTATRSWQTAFLDADNTGIARIVGREESCKTQQVSSRVTETVPYLCGTCFSCNFETLGTGLFTQSLTDHMGQDGLHHLYRFRILTNHLALDNRREVHQYFTVFHHLLDKSRTHHLTVIGNGVIESQCRYRWHLRLIANTHPWQGCFAPVEPLSALVLFRHADFCWRGTHQWYFQIVMESCTIQPLYVFFGILSIVFVYYTTHTDIRTNFQCARQ